MISLEFKYDSVLGESVIELFLDITYVCENCFMLIKNVYT